MKIVTDEKIVPSRANIFFLPLEQRPTIPNTKAIKSTNTDKKNNKPVIIAAVDSESGSSEPEYCIIAAIKNTTIKIAAEILVINDAIPNPECFIPVDPVTPN